MRTIFKSSFLWQFAGGFALGAVGLVTFQPAEATRSLASHFASPIQQTQR